MAGELRDEHDLDLTDGSIVSSWAIITDSSGFSDPVQGHRLHRWAVRADPGTPVTLLAESDDFDAVLYAVSGNDLQYSDDDGPGTDGLVEFVMPATGRVDVLAGRHELDDRAGQYGLRAGPTAAFLLSVAGELRDEHDLDLTDGSIVSSWASITDNSSFSDPIQGHRLHRWAVRADPGTPVTLLAESDGFDAVLYVLSGNDLRYSDDDGPGTDGLVEFVMPATGRVDVLAGRHELDDGDGQYRLRVSVNPG